MSKKIIAKEYLNFLNWLIRGLVVWLLFVVLAFLFLEPNYSFIEMLFAPFVGAGGDGVWWTWLIILFPYGIHKIVKSVKWARNESRAGDKPVFHK